MKLLLQRYRITESAFHFSPLRHVFFFFFLFLLFGQRRCTSQLSRMRVAFHASDPRFSPSRVRTKNRQEGKKREGDEISSSPYEIIFLPPHTVLRDQKLMPICLAH